MAALIVDPWEQIGLKRRRRHPCQVIARLETVKQVLKAVHVRRSAIASTILTE
jgi:hypothetical protein